MLSLYIHIPFCRTICGYCDFYRSADLRWMDGVLAKMLEEMTDRSRDGSVCGYEKGAKLKTIYFGGGTPSLLKIDQIAQFLVKASELFDLSSLSEVTLEANPDDLNPSYLRGLRSIGVDRLSIGVQSFDDKVLQFMGRRHTAQQAIEAIASAREAGFENIAIDIIYGIDGFGGEVLRSTLEQVVRCDVEHVAAYHLTIEEGSRFGRMVRNGRFVQVSESVSEAEFELVQSELRRGGYEHYEVSNFAKSGRRSIHNSRYWSGDSYIGIGPGAHSFNNGVRCWAESSITRYLSGGDERYGVEQLTPEQRRNESVMLALRQCEGLLLNCFLEDYGVEARNRLLDDAAKFIASGALKLEGDRLWIPSEKFLLSDLIIEGLFDL